MTSTLAGASMLGPFLVAGLLGSLHCIGMCGPIHLGLAPILTPAPGSRRGWSASLGLAAFHIGRLWTYSLLGFLVGWGGFELRRGAVALELQRLLSLVLGIVFIGTGVLFLGVLPRRRGTGAGLTGCIAGLVGSRPWLAPLVRTPRLSARLLLGIVLGFLPCGLVYAMLVAALALPTPLHAAAAMSLFGLGTIPSLAAVVVGTRMVPARLRAAGSRLVGAALLLAGLVLALRALPALHPAAHPGAHSPAATTSSPASSGNAE